MSDPIGGSRAQARQAKAQAKQGFFKGIAVAGACGSLVLALLLGFAPHTGDSGKLIQPVMSTGGEPEPDDTALEGPAGPPGPRGKKGAKGEKGEPGDSKCGCVTPSPALVPAAPAAPVPAPIAPAPVPAPVQPAPAPPVYYYPPAPAAAAPAAEQRSSGGQGGLMAGFVPPTVGNETGVGK